MLDPKLIRNSLSTVAGKLLIRGFKVDVALIQELEGQRKELQVKVEQLRSKRNKSSKAIGLAKAKGEAIDELLSHVADFGEQLKTAEEKLHSVQAQLHNIALSIPNIPHESVPAGTDETDNVEVRTVGSKPEFAFTPRDHMQLGESRGLFDFAASSKLSGARFVVMRGQLSKLHRALTQFMLDVHTNDHGYEEVYVPYLVHTDCLYGTGQLPKAEHDLFYVKGDRQLALIPTAEVPVTNLARDTIYNADDLPKHYVAHTPCFRSEAGSYGKDTRGMFRQHQFEKIELVHLVKPENSFAALEELTAHAQRILQLLELPFRVVILCGGDLGFCATKTYDIEVWLPGQQRYREISSCSNMLDFQARRMHARWRNPQTGEIEFIHTLNGSGLAVGRTLIAVMENFQNEDGTIRVPEALAPYMDGATLI